MIWFRRLHKWIGLAIGIQVGIWMLSGLMMGLLDHEHVQGHHYRTVSNVAPLPASSRNVLDAVDIVELAAVATQVNDISLRSYLGGIAYQVTTAGGSQLFDAVSGSRIVVSAEDAATLAKRDYSGPGQIVSIEPVQAPAMEVRRHSGEAWRVEFDDEEATTLYVAADDGRILERRNDTWRLFDVFWMLHIMDYKEREDFNNALVILVSLIAAWFSITGVVLFFDSFRREDFLALVPGGWWRSPARIAVCAPHGEVVARVSSFVGGRLYDELARDDIVLPSNCGGGGTCGLCVVNLGPDWPVSAADRRLLSAHQREQGIRLSCQAKVANDMVVGISDEVLSAQELTAEVVECRFLTPFIREIRLRLPG
ncbi:MAG: PepSY domain-containing protein, partial [Gammaproteobacteria bacterium]|nr:PepSY domain-containing protein [Gammaproteobacteria bacterium]NNL44788.1 2Fe-2S iron-sulfur cluster binding domain-containing protein [Woeseiaceae bacterium]